MSMDRRTIGDLDCAVVDAPGCERGVLAVVVLCHGFGAASEDLVPCAPELYGSVDEGLQQVRFVFPAAPIELEPGSPYDSRAWWPIDMVKLQSVMESGGVRDLREDRPELLDQRNQQLTETIKAICLESNVEMKRVILGGFSQGSMLATEVALSLPELIGGLVVWSGTLLSESIWRDRAAGKAGLRVVQTHGRIDPILPFMGAELLRDMFAEFNIENHFIEFYGQHTIPREAIGMAAELIADVSTSGI